MRQNHGSYLPHIWLDFALFTALLCVATPLFAQKTVVKDAGAGRKLELDYNAADQVTQQRTILADGTVEQKVDYEHRPGYYAADETTTFYGPTGKVRRIIKTTYDASANFTGEFAQQFDETGKQIAGHRLIHDPMTNVYTCADWNTETQSYKPAPCPSGEESAGPAPVKKFTSAEVVKHLDAARKAADAQKLLAASTTKSNITAEQQFGFVVPGQVYPGERVSGSMVANPAEYEGIAGVRVTRVTLPPESAGEGLTLADWRVQVRGESPQSADGPVVFTVPPGGSVLNIMFEQTGSSPRSVSVPIDFPESTAKKQKTPAYFEAAALCLKGQLCTVHGPFLQESTKTFAAFEDRPAPVVAETPDTAYIRIPDLTLPGPRPLFITQGSKVVALPVVVAEFHVKNGDRELQPGQTLVTFPTLEGPDGIPDAAWQPGNFPVSNLDEARQLIPGFQLRREYREQRGRREAQQEAESTENGETEKKGGSILVVVKNLTPTQVSMRGAKNQTIVFHLNDESFSRGDFKYDLIVEAIQSGYFDIRGYVIPFLAPVRGQEFSTNRSSGK